MNNEQHEMVLEITHPSGAEGWYCPTCGRRILRRVPPSNSRVVVEPGDENAYHLGSKGGLRIASVQVTGQDQDGASNEVSEERLRPWIKAIEKLDFNW